MTKPRTGHKETFERWALVRERRFSRGGEPVFLMRTRHSARMFADPDERVVRVRVTVEEIVPKAKARRTTR